MKTPHPSIADIYHIEAENVQAVHDVLDKTKPSVSIIPLLVGAGVLSTDFEGSRVVPAFYYGSDPAKQYPGSVDLLPAKPDTLDDALNKPYFSPHGSIKAATYKNLKSKKGETFVHPAYLIRNGRGTHLFTEIPEDNSNRAQPETLNSLAKIYNLGTIAVSGEVVVGALDKPLPKPGIPAIIREIGQTILWLPYSDKVKSAIVHEVVEELEANRSPDYRKFSIPRPMGRPSRQF